MADNNINNRHSDVCYLFWKYPKRIKRCIYIFNVLAIVQMITVVCLLVVWYNVRQPLPEIEETMCIPAEHEEDVPLPQNLNNITEDGIVKYCGKASDVLKWDTERIIEGLYDGNEHPESRFFPELMPRNCKKTDKVPSIIRLTEIDCKQTKNSSNQRSKIFWKTESGSNASVIIELDGLYRASSHVVLKTDMENIEVRHSLHLKRNGTDEVIMEDREGLCEAYAKIDPEREITTSMTAMFVLKKNDELYLTISHPEYIVDCSETHHFIVYHT